MFLTLIYTEGNSRSGGICCFFAILCDNAFIAKGSFEFTIGDETKVVNQGDSVCMPSGVTHGVTCLEEGILCDVFNPMRKDFL